jgi:hypothetical protein
MIRSSIVLLASALLPCDSIVPEQEFVAFILPSAVPSPVTLPDTVLVNSPFQVAVRPQLTCGSDGIPALVQVSGMTADVTARAVIPEHAKGAIFTCEERATRSIGVVTFGSTGLALVRVHGRDMQSKNTITLSYPVFVKGP